MVAVLAVVVLLATFASAEAQAINCTLSQTAPQCGPPYSNNVGIFCYECQDNINSSWAVLQYGAPISNTSICDSFYNAIFASLQKNGNTSAYTFSNVTYEATSLQLQPVNCSLNIQGFSSISICNALSAGSTDWQVKQLDNCVNTLDTPALILPVLGAVLGVGATAATDCLLNHFLHSDLGGLAICNNNTGHHHTCIASNQTVTARKSSASNSYTTKVNKLNVGDKVLTDKGYRRYIGSIHAGKEDLTITIRMDDGTSIELTRDHLIKSKKGFVHAKDIKVGDVLEVFANNVFGYKNVIETKDSTSHVVSPITSSGTIVVNDVIVSCYAIVKYHHFANFVYLPVRLGIVDSEYYTVKLTHAYNVLPMWFKFYFNLPKGFYGFVAKGVLQR